MLPTFKSWTVHKIIEYLTLGLSSSLWNINHSTTAYFFDPPCTCRLQAPLLYEPAALQWDRVSCRSAWCTWEWANNKCLKALSTPTSEKHAGTCRININQALFTVMTVMWLRLWCNCNVTATRNESVHFSAKLHEVTANHNAGIGMGLVDQLWRYCLLLFLACFGY